MIVKMEMTVSLWLMVMTGTFKRVFKNEDAKTITLQPLNMQRDENGKLLYEPRIYTEEQIEELPVRILGVFEELRRKKKKK